jgi:hypothetical protein
MLRNAVYFNEKEKSLLEAHNLNVKNYFFASGIFFCFLNLRKQV